MVMVRNRKISLDELIEYINHLSPKDRLQIVSKVTHDLSEEELGEKWLDIRNLRGLGKEIWQGMDAQEYVNKERESWNS